MADFTNSGFQANVNRSRSGTGGGGTILNVGGRSFSSTSPEGIQWLAKNRQDRLGLAKQTLASQTNLATAEVEADAQDYEADQNRQAGQQAFQYALSQAGGRRQPGGGIARGGAGRRGMSLNQATGGLAAANAAARKKAQMGLAQARVAADPENIRLQQQIKGIDASTQAGPRLTRSGQAIFKK